MLLWCFIDRGMTWSICIPAWKSAFRHRWFRWIVTRHFTVTCFQISTLGEHGDTRHSDCRMRSSVQLCKLTMSFRGQNNRTIPTLKCTCERHTVCLGQFCHCWVIALWLCKNVCGTNLYTFRGILIKVNYINMFIIICIL